MTLLTWEFLHNLTHIDYHFNKVPNQFVLPDHLHDVLGWHGTSYQQSIQMFALLPIAFGLVYFAFSLLMILICCTNKCCCTSKKRHYNQNVKPRSNTRIMKDSNSVRPYRLDSTSYSNTSVNSPNSMMNSLPLAPLHPHRVIDLNASKNNGEEEEDTTVVDRHSKLSHCAKYSRVIIQFLSLILIGSCFYVGYQLNSTIIDVQDQWDDSYQPYNDCIHEGSEIDKALSNANKQCDKIQEIAPEFDTSTMKELQSAITESQQEVDEYLADAKLVAWGKSDDIDKYRSFAIYVGLSLLSLTAVVILISTFCTKSLSTMRGGACICCNSLINVILLVCILLLWILSSIQFAASVQVSDVCGNPQESILQAVNISQNANKISADTYQIVEYYVYCDAEHKYNPLEDYTNYAYDTLEPFNSTVSALANCTEAQSYGIANETIRLWKDYQIIMKNLVLLNDSLKCDDVNAYMDKVTDDLCVNGVDYWYFLYAIQAFVLLILVVRNCCICTKSDIDYEYSDELMVANEYNVLVPLQPDEEYHPQVVFSDGEVRKCIAYLLPYIENVKVLMNVGKDLERNGYNDDGIPVHAKLVQRAIAILKNYNEMGDSKYQHPLLRGLV